MSHSHPHYSQYNHNGAIPQASQPPMSQNTPIMTSAPRQPIIGIPQQQQVYPGRAPQSGMQNSNRPISRPEPVVRGSIPTSQYQIPLSQSMSTNTNTVPSSSQMSYSQSIPMSQSPVQFNRQLPHSHSHFHPQPQTSIPMSQHTTSNSPRTQSNVNPVRPQLYQQAPPQPQYSQQQGNQYNQQMSSQPPLSQSPRPSPAAVQVSNAVYSNFVPSSQSQQYQYQKQPISTSAAPVNQSVLPMQPPPPRHSMQPTPVSISYPPPPSPSPSLSQSLSNVHPYDNQSTHPTPAASSPYPPQQQQQQQQQQLSAVLPPYPGIKSAEDKLQEENFKLRQQLMKLNQENYELKSALTKTELKSKEIVDSRVQQLESQLKFENEKLKRITKQLQQAKIELFDVKKKQQQFPKVDIIPLSQVNDSEALNPIPSTPRPGSSHSLQSQTGFEPISELKNSSSMDLQVNRAIDMKSSGTSVATFKRQNLLHAGSRLFETISTMLQKLSSSRSVNSPAGNVLEVESVRLLESSLRCIQKLSNRDSSSSNSQLITELFLHLSCVSNIIDALSSSFESSVLESILETLREILKIIVYCSPFEMRCSMFPVSDSEAAKSSNSKLIQSALSLNQLNVFCYDNTPNNSEATIAAIDSTLTTVLHLLDNDKLYSAIPTTVIADILTHLLSLCNQISVDKLSLSKILNTKLILSMILGDTKLSNDVYTVLMNSLIQLSQRYQFKNDWNDLTRVTEDRSILGACCKIMDSSGESDEWKFTRLSLLLNLSKSVITAGNKRALFWCLGLNFLDKLDDSKKCINGIELDSYFKSRNCLYIPTLCMQLIRLLQFSPFKGREEVNYMNSVKAMSLALQTICPLFDHQEIGKVLGNVREALRVRLEVIAHDERSHKRYQPIWDILASLHKALAD